MEHLDSEIAERIKKSLLSKDEEKEAIIQINLSILKKDPKKQIWDLDFCETSDDEDNDTDEEDAYEDDDEEEERMTKMVSQKMGDKKVSATNKTERAKLLRRLKGFDKISQLQAKLDALNARLEEIKKNDSESDGSDEDDEEDEDEDEDEHENENEVHPQTCMIIDTHLS